MRALAFCVLLAACAAPQTPPPGDVRLLRNPTANLGSQADVTAADLSGDWIVRQAVPGSWPGGAGALSLVSEGPRIGFTFRADVCDRAGICFTAEERVLYAPTLAGRWQVENESWAQEARLPRQIWVLWMDFDRRTVALGDPEGSFVAILDRDSAGGADRITAARDILDWYGYDLTRLEEVQ